MPVTRPAGGLTAPGWSGVAGTVSDATGQQRITRPAGGLTAPGWGAVAGTAPATGAPLPAPPSSYVGPTTSTSAPAAPRSYPSSYQVTPGYDMSVPGASEYLLPATGPLQQSGYSEAYANSPAYQAAQQSTQTNRLLNSVGGAIAQPTAFENYALSTAAPEGDLYSMIAANRGQVTGTSDLMRYATSGGPQTGNLQNTMGAQIGQVTGQNDVLNLGRTGVTDVGRGENAFEGSGYMVTNPSRIGSYMADPRLYGSASGEGMADDVAESTRGLVYDNTLGRYAAATPSNYADASRMTASEREMNAASRDMASGVDTTTAAGRYWEELQRNPTALPDANLDAYYDRQRQKAQQDIDRVMAARGLFGSSASIDASREMMLDLAARQVKDESEYSLAAALARNDISSGAARGADESGISRYLARNETARGVDDAALGLSRLGLDARAANDENSLARYIAANKVASDIDAGARDLYLGRGDLMNRSDLTDTARFDAYNQAANALDQTDIDAYSARAAAMEAGGRLDVDRYNASVNASNLADRVGIDAYATRADALRDAGQLDVNRFNANAAATSDADRTSLDRYIAQSDVMARGADTMIDRYRALTEGATAADNASRSLYTAGADVARNADSALNDRFNTLGTLAGNADLSRTGRTQVANETQYNYTSLLDSILNSGYGDLIQSDEEIISLINQLGLGAGAMNLQGALGNQAGVGTQGAQLQQIGGQVDATNRAILLRGNMG